MSRFAAAAALACTVVLVNTPGHARPGFRIFSSASKIVSVKPAAAAAAPARRGSSLFIATGSRSAAATGTPQQAVSDPATAPSPFDPSLVQADAKNADFKADPKALTAASSDCAMKEPAAAKDAAKEKQTMAAAQEPAKIEAANVEPAKTEPPRAESARSRSAFLVPVVNRHPQAPRPRQTVVCYVQRDGSCAP
jgi:hypothetical protein